MFFTSSRGKIFYEIRGKGDPLLLIHGTPFSSWVWEQVVEALSDHFQFYTFDLLGYGRSEKPQDISLGVQNEVLCELLDTWDLEKPAVVAHDFGGATLLRSIGLNRRRFTRIMLIDVVALSPWGSPFVRHVRKHLQAFIGIPEYIHRAIVQAYIKDAILREVTNDEIEQLVEPWMGKIGQAAFYRQISQMDQRYTEEVQHVFQEIQVPTRILWGKNDSWIPIEMGRKLHSLIGSSEFIEVDRSNHLMQFDRPELIIEQIVNFF